jgi:hypothetical protein
MVSTSLSACVRSPTAPEPTSFAAAAPPLCCSKYADDKKSGTVRIVCDKYSVKAGKSKRVKGKRLNGIFDLTDWGVFVAIKGKEDKVSPTGE